MDYCENFKANKYMRMTFVAVISALLIFSLASCGKSGPKDEAGSGTAVDNRILSYTCGMHPSVRVTPDEYNSGTTSCPICNMDLTPVYEEKDEGSAEESEYYGCGMEGEEHVFAIQQIKGMTKCPVCGMPLKKLSKEEADRLRGVVSKVTINGEQARLAGVKTEEAHKRHLYKTIRTAGNVAYDPQLAVAEEEFISSLAVLGKIQEGGNSEIEERASNLINSSRRKLKLLGLSEGQIKELEDTREIHAGLVLPDEKMWIYGDVYEYELGWVKQGTEIEVTTAGLPGEKFTGIVSSVNPVLDSKTRSVKFRAEVDNPGLKLKPEMYVDIIIKSMYTAPDGRHLVLAIPKEAVLDTGTRKIIWIDKGNGEYEGRIVRVGPEAVADIDGKESKFYPVLEGAAEGDKVVSRANFLIDSQSQISGVAAAAYGGALEAEDEEAAVPIHQH